MKTYVFILSAFILTLLASCEKPSANQSSSQSSTQLQKEASIPIKSPISDEITEPIAIPKPEGAGSDYDEQAAEIQERLAIGKPTYAANILGYRDEDYYDTEAFKESDKWMDELVRLASTPELMSKHGITMSSQQLKDLKAKEIEALQQWVCWSDARIEELTKIVDNLKESGETTKAQAYELEIKLYQDYLEVAKLRWQELNK